MDLGHKLKMIRHQTGLSQKEFAKRLGTSQQNISNYENELAEPSVEYLVKLAAEFSISLDELLLNKDPGIEREFVELLSNMPEDRKDLSKKVLQAMIEDTEDRSAIQ